MSARLRLSVSIQNHAGRKGVPIARSFERWVRAALMGRRSGRVEVNIALFDEAAARDLNRQYRGKDYATNVLSFSYQPLPRENPALLGELAFCPAIIAREAHAQGKQLRDHYTHLTVHGVLHLLGYTHDRQKDAEEMEAIELRTLAGLRVPDPYA